MKKLALLCAAALIAAMLPLGTALLEQDAPVRVYGLVGPTGMSLAPLIAEDDYKKRETRSFLGKLFDGRASDLLAALVACDEVTADDIEEIRERFGLK